MVEVFAHGVFLLCEGRALFALTTSLKAMPTELPANCWVRNVTMVDNLTVLISCELDDGRELALLSRTPGWREFPKVPFRAHLGGLAGPTSFIQVGGHRHPAKRPDRRSRANPLLLRDP